MIILLLIIYLIDGYDAFHQSGNCFDKETALRVKKFIYSAGNSLNPSEAYRLFRGRFA